MWFRAGVTLVLLLALLAIEFLAPRRLRGQSRYARWPGNLLIQLINGLILRGLFPWMLPAVVAVSVASQQWGLFNLLPLPYWISLLCSVILLDCLIYWQHRLMHQFPILWRLHRMHHADRDVDVTTALRFHPLEMILSTAIKSAAVLMLGAPPEAVILFAILLNGMAMFNHANIRLPEGLDGLLRKLVVTPDMHRVHHSVIFAEHNSNFGFNLSIWDRLFGSYVAQPEQGHEQMELGLNETNDQQTGSVWWMLKQPFR